MTMTRKERRLYAGEQARDLAKLVRELAQPSSETRMLQNAVNAQVVINRIVWALQLDDEKPSGTIRERIQADLEKPMQGIADVLNDVLSPHGWALLVFSAEFSNYISNCVRDDIVAAMREFIAHHEHRIQPEPAGPSS